MTPKEKASELFEAMSGIGDEHHHCTHYVAKQCALIAVDEIMSFMKNDDEESDTVYWANHPTSTYWIEVKQEIQKL